MPDDDLAELNKYICMDLDTERITSTWQLTIT